MDNHFRDVPKYVSRLRIGNDFAIDFTRSKPNRWWRMWQYLLLGFTWEDLND